MIATGSLGFEFLVGLTVGLLGAGFASSVETGAKTVLIGGEAISVSLWERLRQESPEEPLLAALVEEAVEAHHLNPARA